MNTDRPPAAVPEDPDRSSFVNRDAATFIPVLREAIVVENLLLACSPGADVLQGINKRARLTAIQATLVLGMIRKYDAIESRDLIAPLEQIRSKARMLIERTSI
jgi:hypothetical protein